MVEDTWQRRIGSRVVLVSVPSGWGRTTLLEQFAAVTEQDDAPVTLLVSISSKLLPDGAGVQAQVIRDLLMEAGLRRRAAELLGVIG